MHDKPRKHRRRSLGALASLGEYFLQRPRRAMWAGAFGDALRFGFRPRMAGQPPVLVLLHADLRK